MEKVEIINSIIKFWHYYQKEPEKKKKLLCKIECSADETSRFNESKTDTRFMILKCWRIGESKQTMNISTVWAETLSYCT